MKHIASLLLVAVLFATNTADACSVPDWGTLLPAYEQFLNQPTEKNAQVVLDGLPSCYPDGTAINLSYPDSIVPNAPIGNSDYKKLLTLAQKGNVAAVRIMFKMTWLFEGGENDETLVEDMGKLSDTRSREFLLAYSGSSGNIHGMTHILLMLGPEYVDDYASQLKELKKRYAALEQVSDVPGDARSECLSILDKKIRWLEKRLAS